MQNHPQNRQPVKPPKQRIRLPFENKSGDPGEWSYDHRVGICITLIAYLLFGIVFVAGKISLSPDKGQGNILVEFPEEQKSQLTPEEIEMLRAMAAMDDFSDVSNRASNENAELNANLRDDRSSRSQASELYDEAGSLDDKMRANREAYEAGLAKINEMAEAAKNSGKDEQQQIQNTKIKGRVTVSFEFSDPVRNSVKLVIPAYLCEGGGEIRVIATLDQSGHVISATVDRGASSPDRCMQETAVNAARSSRFNVDTSAPAKQQGTITYVFIPQ